MPPSKLQHASGQNIYLCFYFIEIYGTKIYVQIVPITTLDC